jgi:hypothetical protein
MQCMYEGFTAGRSYIVTHLVVLDATPNFSVINELTLVTFGHAIKHD